MPYSVNAFPQTRPERLAAVAALFGLEAPRPRRCHVLELACASGGNLIPLALTSADSTFVGIDLSGRQIADGQAVVRELKLGNVELKAMSILDVGDDFGTFDYILAHGVYSWVPAEVQDKILDICRKNLSANGVAYVSYNTYPGWHARGAIREMLCYHTDRFSEPSERITEARKLLNFLAQSVQQGDGGYATLLCRELAVLAQTPDSYLLHEHLEEYNEPLYFHQFAERAAAKGLQYLAEAHVGAMIASRFGAEAEQTLRQISPGLLHMEQYMDFLRNRMFRQTLLCHDALALDHVLRHDAVKHFYVAAAVKPVSANPNFAFGQQEEFRGRAGATLVTHDPLLKATMGILSKFWPLPVCFTELLAAARTQLGDRAPDAAEAADSLAVRLLNCHTSGLVEFTLTRPAFRIDVTEFPVASPYARLRARDGGNVINLRLETVPMGTPSRLVLEHLDGTHDHDFLSRLVAGWLEKESPAVPGAATAPAAAVPQSSNIQERAARYVALALHGFARSALLTG
ncbi:MAG TPA: class I SAM-dependent methyltransferase [Pirellulales bacterium]|nr:class I SAM-dependent methyltransferase [Pirellulales bacterium]